MTIYAKTPSFQASAKYERYSLRVDFSQTLDENETGYEELIELFGRDLHETQIPLLGGDVLKIGAPVFKCMLLPRLEAASHPQRRAAGRRLLFQRIHLGRRVLRFGDLHPTSDPSRC